MTARLDGALSNLIYGKMFLLIAGEVNKMMFKTPFQTKLFFDSVISILCISPTTCHHTFAFCGFFKQQDATPQRHLLSDTQFLEMQNTRSWDCESFSQFILVTTCESRSLSENRIPVLPKKSPLKQNPIWFC